MKQITKNLPTFYNPKGYTKYLENIAGKTLKEQKTITRELITLLFPCNNQVLRYYYLWRTETLNEDDWEFLRQTYVITRFKELQILEENNFKTFKALMYNLSLRVPYNGSWKYNQYIAPEYEEEAKRICNIWEYPELPSPQGVHEPIGKVMVKNFLTDEYYGTVDDLGSIIVVNDLLDHNPLLYVDLRVGMGSFLVTGGSAKLLFCDDDGGTGMVQLCFTRM